MLIGGFVYLYNSETFERNKPTVQLKSPEYWNLSKPLQVVIEDESGIKYYKVTIKANGTDTVLKTKIFDNESKKKRLDLNVSYPKIAGLLKTAEVTLRIEAVDASKWDFMAGNKVIKEQKLFIDQRRPQVSVITHNYHIQKGGSGIVIFKAKDTNLDELYIQTNYGKRFIPQPFYKKDYYISLFAWPVKTKSFSAKIIAIDKAGNIKRSSINIRTKDRRYKISKIKLTDRFLNNKIAELASEFDQTQGVDDPLKQFKIINEVVRKANEDVIRSITSKVPNTTISNFNIKKLYPLKNAKAVASFGERRFYSYKGKRISQAYHLGLDLASIKNGDILTQNPSELVFAAPNGIYGNMAVLHHGMGLYTIYGHTSNIPNEVGTHIERKGLVAITGKSGYAFGDHLHFGVLVQGIEVRPEEWMDQKWIRDNITSVIATAKDIINNR